MITDPKTGMKPMMIVPPGLFSDSARKQLKDNGICVVVAKDPAKVRFMDPIPAISSRSAMEGACIKMSRLLLNRMWGDFTTSGHLTQEDIVKMFVSFLVEGTDLGKDPTKSETEKEVYDQAHWDEVRKIAREDARAEREAQKQAKLKGESK